MEDKHIYSTSFWSKLQDKLRDSIRSIRKTIQDMKPKPKSNGIPTTVTKTKIPETPVVSKMAVKKTASYEKPQPQVAKTYIPEKPETEKVKTKKPKKEKVKKFHYKRMASESIQKVLVSVLLIAIIGIFGTGAYLSNKDKLNLQINTSKPKQLSPSPTPDITDSWEIYTNEKFKFEFKYPPNWVSQPIVSKNVISQLGEYFEGGRAGGSSPLYFYISIEPYETIFAQDIENDGTEIINQEKVKIDNNTYVLNTHKQFEVEAAYKIIDYIPINDSNQKGLYLYFSHTAAGCSLLPLEIQAACLKENDKNNIKYRDTRNQILSTFRFLDTKCVDSDAFCKEKDDGTSCNYGVWCNEEGKICGGQSCTGLSLGKCINNKCVLQEEAIPKQ